MDSLTSLRLDGIILMVNELIRRNLNVDRPCGQDENPLDTVADGLDMLGQELERYRTEILQERAFQQNILNSIDEVIYVRTVDTARPVYSPYSFISERCTEIIGLYSKDLSQQPERWTQAVHPEDKELLTQTYAKLLTGQQVHVTYRIYHNLKMEHRWIEDRIFPELDDQGQVIRLYGSARDITQQHQTALQLNKTNQLVNRLITSSDQVFYIIEIDQTDPFKNTFTYLSPHVEGIIGYSVEDVQNDPLIWFNAIHTADFESLTNTTREMFRNRIPGTRIYRMKHKLTGKYVWIEDYVVPIMDQNGWVKEFYASARDITSRKEAEMERETLIVEMSRKNEELMQFNHIVSHNLRSPVASIIGLAEFLQNEIGQSELQQAKAYLLQSALAMDEVLKDLNSVLSVRSPLLGKMTRFSITDTLSAVCINLKKEIEQNRASIDIKVEHGTDQLTSIKSYIHSIFFNLISNAIKYRAPGRTPMITIRATTQTVHTVISIKDNGMGIDLKAHGQYIFTPYARINSTGEGKGLGLYMVKNQTEALKGSIEVDSEIGIGTTFTITL